MYVPLCRPLHFLLLVMCHLRLGCLTFCMLSLYVHGQSSASAPLYSSALVLIQSAHGLLAEGRVTRSLHYSGSAHSACTQSVVLVLSWPAVPYSHCSSSEHSAV